MQKSSENTGKKWQIFKINFEELHIFCFFNLLFRAKPMFLNLLFRDFLNAMVSILLDFCGFNYFYWRRPSFYRQNHIEIAYN